MRILKENIFAVGAIDFDVRLFDRLIPLPDGTSYNSYLIRGSEGTALLDTVDPSKTDILLANLAELGIERIDYVVSHHGEQDHSGSIPAILEKYPGAKVVTNGKCQKMLMDLLGVGEEQFIVVEDLETIDLGDKTLQFIFLPWVHWPDTMATYVKEDKILFSCDFFGAHLATSDLFVTHERDVYEPAKRYYAEIMMPFRKIIKKNIEKLSNFEIEMISPSHGPVHKSSDFIIDAYKEWIDDDVKNEVIVPYVSMHGSTAKMVEYLVRALIKRGIEVKQFELSTVDIGKLAIALVDAATMVIGTPTVLVGPHPCAAYAAFLANALRPKTKFASIIGSFGWGSKAVEQLVSMIPNLKVELIDPVIVKGDPKESDFLELDKLADNILCKHKELGISE